jgi:UDP-N-acetylmuramoyl-L-alanyl-D-glutamate--2,6-diaminopimelate ligase
MSSMRRIKETTTSQLAEQLNGNLKGPEKRITGIFNILKDAQQGDVVIRHWIDEKGIEIAAKKGVSCVVTQNPRGNVFETAEKLRVPIIVTEKIELANAFALDWAVENFARYALRMVVTGTNGKSTTTHLIYSILKEAGYTTYTNTDSKSEFNTLIDPMVAKQIAEFSEKIEAMVLEVSEVQGWMDRIMKNHAQIMTSAVDPDVLVLTNVSLDHFGLVNSVEETFEEISGAVKVFNGDYVVLNSDDPLIKKMEKFLSRGVSAVFYGTGSHLELQEDGIYYQEKIFMEKDELPFKSAHFIQNIMAAISTTIELGIEPVIIKKAVSSYKPLDRRFTVIRRNPLIIDDFAHNPDGILATIKSASQLTKGKLLVVSAIRGSRGDSINQVNADAIVEGLAGVDHLLIITSSREMVDHANLVKSSEKKVFIKTVEKSKLNYIFQENLSDALKYAIESANESDTILLIGAQGMDPAGEILKKIEG